MLKGALPTPGGLHSVTPPPIPATATPGPPLAPHPSTPAAAPGSAL